MKKKNKSETRFFWWKGIKYQEFKFRGKWYTVPRGGKGGGSIVVPPEPQPDPELVSLQKEFLNLSLSELKAGPSDLDAAIQELAQLAVEQTRKTIEEGPTIPDELKEAIRGSFGQAREDVLGDLTKSFETFGDVARRNVTARGLQEGTLLPDILSKQSEEQGVLLERAISRLASQQALAEQTGAFDLADLTSQALNVSTGRSIERLGQRFGLLGGTSAGATNFFNQELAGRQRAADRALQASISAASLGGGGGGLSSIIAGVGAAGGLLSGLGAVGFGGGGAGAAAGLGLLAI